MVNSSNGQVLTVAGDITRWAGQTVSLSIVNSTSGGEIIGVVDDVSFSPQLIAVPEPSEMELLATAISVFVVFVNKRKAI